MDKIAYIVDGGFFIKKFKTITKVFPTADAVEKYIHSIQKYIQEKYLSGPSEIYRIFFYDCQPLENETH